MLDAKKITLRDGKERSIRVTWAALERIRSTAGLDMLGSPDSTEMLRKIPAVLHACLVDRSGDTVEELAELIEFSDAQKLVEAIFSALSGEEAAKPDSAARPLMNGVSKDSPSSSVTPSAGTTSG